MEQKGIHFVTSQNVGMTKWNKTLQVGPTYQSPLKRSKRSTSQSKDLADFCPEYNFGATVEALPY